MEMKQNIPLALLTTLRIGGPASCLIEAGNKEEIKEALAFAEGKGLSLFILGGGSNLLVADRGFSGVVIRPNLLEREVLEENGESALVSFGAGELLDGAVAWAVERGWWGMENLSMVPGSVGAAPVANVGCYGVTVSDIIEWVEVLDKETGEIKKIKNADCGFGYRSSIFNTGAKNRYIILRVAMRLWKEGAPNLEYWDVKQYFENVNVRRPSLPQMRFAISSIRKKKGQDTGEFWSAGSFFKNLRLAEDEYNVLKKNIIMNFGREAGKQVENLKNRFREPESIKIPAGFIMDRLLHLHGARVGDAALSPRQIIMIINLGKATANDVMRLFKRVRQIVFHKTGAKLTNEPELVGFEPSEIDDLFSLT